MPKVSVIVPVYNVEPYLRKCLDSLLAQTLRDIEIICVDDGSKDRSSEILAEFAAADARFHVIRRPNGGLAAARNTGLGAARASYVMFCDADDWVEPTWCEEHLAAIASDESVDLVVSRAFIDGICDRKTRAKLREHQCLKYADVQDARPEMFLRIDHAVWIKIYRRSLIERYGIRFPEGTLCEDWLFSQEYFAVSRKVKFIDRQLYHYFQRKGSILNGGESADRASLDFVSHWDRFRRFLAEKGLWTRWRVVMLDYAVNLFGSGNERLRVQIYDLADAALAAMPTSDFENLPKALGKGLEMVRRHEAHRFQCRRIKIGPFCVGKVKRSIESLRVYVLGLRVYWRRF